MLPACDATLLVCGVCKETRFIYFHFTELKVCERVNTCTLSFLVVLERKVDLKYKNPLMTVYLCTMTGCTVGWTPNHSISWFTSDMCYSRFHSSAR